MMETSTTGSGSEPWYRKIPTVRVGKKHALYMASIDGHYLVIQFAGASFLKNNQPDILNFLNFTLLHCIELAFTIQEIA